MLNRKRDYNELVCEYSSIVYDQFAELVYGLTPCNNSILFDEKEDYKIEIALRKAGFISVHELEDSGIKVNDLENIRGSGNIYTVVANTYINNTYETTINEFTSSGYVHTQSAPATTWTIVHGLGFCPNITITDLSGQRISGQVNYSGDCSIITITFNSAFSGKAYLS